MELAPEDARVVACLVEKEANVPDSYPLTLNALRLACNQTSNRDPVVAYDDRRVESSLLSLKSMGLVRFVHPSHGGRTIRYRHIADERWHLSKGEIGVLAALGAARSADGRRDPRGACAYPTTRARSRRSSTRWPRAAPIPSPSGCSDGPASARPGGRTPCPVSPTPARRCRNRSTSSRSRRRQDLARDVAELWLRVERMEKLLGLSEALPAASVPDDRSG